MKKKYKVKIKNKWIRGKRKKLTVRRKSNKIEETKASIIREVKGKKIKLRKK